MVKEQTVPVAIHVRQGNYTKWYTLSVPPIQKDQGDWQSSNYSNWYRYQSSSCVRWNTDKILCNYHMRKAITPTGTVSAFHLTRGITVSGHNTGYVTMAMKLRDNFITDIMMWSVY